MARLPRITQKPFGTSGPTSDFGQFGSYAAGTPVTTMDLSVIQNLTAFAEGLAGAVISQGDQPNIPLLEDLNSLFLLLFQQIRYIFEEGIPEYDASTTYYTNSFCQKSGAIYKSLIDSNLGNDPASSPSDWQNIASVTPNGYLYGGVLSNDSVDATNGIAFTATTAKDDTNTYTINAIALTKKVNSAWAAGNNAGGLDTGSIGASPVLVYCFAIGKSTDSTAGDYLFSKSRTTPTMPTGWDIKRLLGHRRWNGTSWDKFVSSGKGTTRKTMFYSPIHVVTAGSATSPTDVDVSAYVDGNISTIANLQAYAFVNADGVNLYIRPKGSTDTSNGSVFVATGAGQPAVDIIATGEIVINASSVYQYWLSSGSTEQYLRGFIEEL